ncbi:hypothetical protein [Ponticaulis sp.]|uniref:hypothetical protein n=1 Tax=Ponticaulis sp. TaxID=2020902 RepID=UPI0025EDBF40|nr:hypothetical protein [Ponticaulis sp.]
MTRELIGHSDALREFLDRKESGRFPHAWLFEGPKGIGKFSAARLLAAIVLGSMYNINKNKCLVEFDQNFHKVEAESHPDFRIISRQADSNGKLPPFISVDQVRAMNGFFELRAAQGGYRIAIVDAVDELNANGANALLKTLEEPPENCLLILIHHGSVSMLPTIRSRCVSLKFGPLGDSDLREVHQVHDAHDVSDQLVSLCEGSPGRLEQFLDIEGDALLNAMKLALKDSFPVISSSRIAGILALMTQSEEHMDLAITDLSSWLAVKAREAKNVSLSRRYSEGWAALHETRARGQRLKLDLSEQASSCLKLLVDLGQDMSETV